MVLFLIVFFSFPRVIAELKKDPFSIGMYSGVNDLEQKYPDAKFALYACSKKHESSYNSVAFSVLFLLEQKYKYSNNGIKIGIEGDCQHPKQSKPEIHPVLSKIGIRDFSNASESAILEAGWKAISFSGMYNQYARWWFEEKP